MAFNMKSIMNNKANTQADSTYKTIRLELSKLEASNENFYAVENIEELAESIRLCGLQQPIVCAKVEGIYKIISGHRRKSALEMLVEQGEEKYKIVPCMYKEMTANMFTISLIMGNAFTRKLSDYELLEQAKRLKEALTMAKDSGELVIEGKMRDCIAKMMDLSYTKIAQIEAINNNLTEEGKEEIMQGQLNFTKAYELSKLSEEQQKDILENGQSMTAQEVREIAKENKKAHEEVEQERVEQKIETYDPEAEQTLIGTVGQESLGEVVVVSDTDTRLGAEDVLQELFLVSEWLSQEEISTLNYFLKKCKGRQC